MDNPCKTEGEIKNDTGRRQTKQMNTHNTDDEQH